MQEYWKKKGTGHEAIPSVINESLNPLRPGVSPLTLPILYFFFFLKDYICIVKPYCLDLQCHWMVNVCIGLAIRP